MARTKLTRIGYLSWHPAPYRDDFIKRIIKSDQLDVVVYTAKCTGNEHTFLPPEYPTEFLMPQRKSDVGVLWRMMHKLVFGGFDFTFWPGFMSWPVITCEIVCILLGKKYVFCTDCVEEHKTSVMKKWLRRFIICHSYALIVGGGAGRYFFKTEYGMPDEKMLDGVYSLEGDTIESRIVDLRKRRRDIRELYGMNEDDKIFLMVANITPKRHYPITVAAFRKFAAKNSGCKFVICGAGSGLDEMKCIADEEESIVVIPGVPFDEMLKLYAMADVYVHGGKEPASTALQIGAIANLPLISSKAVGLAWDVVKDGVSGIEVANFLEVEEWESAFLRIMDMRDKWMAMGKMSRALSRKLDAAVVAEKFVNYFLQKR